MRLKLRRREVVLLSVLAVAAVVALWPRINRPGATPAAQSRSRPDAPLAPVPRIDLDRLDGARAEAEVGRRDLFAYGPLRPAGGPGSVIETPTNPASPPRTAQPPAADPTGSLARRGGGASLPPMNLKFIGSVGNERGVKVAVLLTDKNEVLTGQPGEVVANRYRIARIGIESVDLEDVGTGQSRRIPLKGN